MSAIFACPPSYEGGRIDFHTHILPGIDDGSRSPEESLQMIRASAEAGVRCIALTPHFYAGSDHPDRFIARRNSAVERLKEALAEADDLPPIYLVPGAEVEYFEGITVMGDFPAFRLGGSRCLLLEMPHGRWTSHIVSDILDLHHRGDCRVVLAHVERYLFEQSRDTIHKLLDAGVVMQSNAQYFLHRMTAGKAMRMLRKGYIHLLGSDCHNMTTRAPDLGAACAVIERHAGPQFLEDMMSSGFWMLRDGSGKI